MMVSISIENINKETLNHVSEICALLKDGTAPVIASRPETPTMMLSPSHKVEPWSAVSLMNSDRSPFDDIQEARQALQTVRKLLSKLCFSPAPSKKAKQLLAAISSDRINEHQAGQAAGLSREELDDVLSELEDSHVHRHPDGLISKIPEPSF